MDVEKLYEYFLKSNGVSTDTRKIKAGELFFALKGNHFNANEFALQAIGKGASYAVIDGDDFKDHKQFVVVENVLKALQKLAAHHRERFNIPVIAIAGSNGKTTTKELTASVLQKKYNVHFTKGNLNNHIGLPLTLLELNNNHEIAVIEMGANHLSETAFLCSLAKPTHGLITNNGKDHLEGYGNLGNVRKANGELFDFLQKENGICFVSSLQKDLFEQSEKLNRVTYGNLESDYCRGNVESSYPFLVINIFNKAIKSSVIQTKLVGDYNLENVLAAATIGKYFGVAEGAIKNAIENYLPQNNRSQLLKYDGNIFFVDCYNANPTSMSLAIEDFNKWNVGKKIIILGDMFELGDSSAEEHNEIVKLAESKNFYKKIYIGPLFHEAAKKIEDAILLSDYEQLKIWFANNKLINMHILLKGSHGMMLEKIFD
jgi:UDP-N-acetylmuramoyl-tripeptide--D-alanyl-D-alanine ligase